MALPALGVPLPFTVVLSTRQYGSSFWILTNFYPFQRASTPSCPYLRVPVIPLIPFSLSLIILFVSPLFPVPLFTSFCPSFLYFLSPSPSLPFISRPFRFPFSSFLFSWIQLRSSADPGKRQHILVHLGVKERIYGIQHTSSNLYSPKRTVLQEKDRHNFNALHIWLSLTFHLWQS